MLRESINNAKINDLARPQLRGIAPSWGGIRKVGPMKRQGTLLERIRAKEASRKVQRPSELQERQDTFLKSLLPQILNICRELSHIRSTFLMANLVDKIYTSLSSRLSASEIGRSLQLLADAEPEFCRIVRSGPVTVVKFSSPPCIQKVNAEKLAVADN